MNLPHGEYEIDDALARIDFARVHSWLETTYWSPGIPRARVERAAAGSSLVIGAYQRDQQVAYCRVVSDRATFAWLADVFVDPNHRSRGLAKAMVQFALAHPDHQGLRRWVLATADAHPIYAACGFQPLFEPEKWMVRLLARPS
jgi:GNAT superfamily N-acetyltransferase